MTGADSGIAPHMAHGQLHRSVSFFVEADAPITEALAAGPSVFAQACGIGDRKGLLRPGYAADVIVMNGDLQAEIDALSDVRTVKGK